MPPEEVVDTAPAIDDRRAALEAAFDASSQAEPKEEVVQETKQPEGDADTGGGADEASPAKSEAAGAAEPGTPEEDSEPAVADTKVFSVEKAPQSWRGPQKAKWNTLDPDVRQEVVRREREITRTLSESASARSLANNFQQAVQPYMARIQTQGGNPIAAVQSLLAADHLLHTAPKDQRAQLMAKLINDYGVDVVALDAALSGQPRKNAITDEVGQLLQQRLAPLEQFLNSQKQREQQTKQQQEAEMQQTIVEMSEDPVKYPYFDQVRDTMADIIDVMAKKGKTISLTECYNKAIAMDPQVSAELAAKAEAANKAKQVATQNSVAQRAKQASASVSGAPSGTRAGAPVGDRRATIAAAFEQMSGW